MKLNNYFKNEPDSYTYLEKKLEISIEEFNKSIQEKNIDSHTQIKQAYLYANRLEIFISFFLSKKKLNFLDCGCGMGFIARELKNLSNHNIHYCDPSTSVKKIHEKIFPKENFFQSDIENLVNHKKKFDLIYLREVYPFTRDNNFNNQKRLINILNNLLNEKGVMIFEQIKNKEDLFDNLEKFNLRYKIIFLLPIKLSKKKLLNQIFFKSNLCQFLLKFIYKIFRKKINNFIIIYKF